MFLLCCFVRFFVPNIRCISTFMKPLAHSFTFVSLSLSLPPVFGILFAWATYLIPFICMVDGVLSEFLPLVVHSSRLVSSHFIFSLLTCQRNGVDDSHRCCVWEVGKNSWRKIQIHTFARNAIRRWEGIGCANEENRNGPSYSFQNISVLELMRFKVISTKHKHRAHTHTSHRFACTIEIFVNASTLAVNVHIFYSWSQMLSKWFTNLIIVTLSFPYNHHIYIRRI